jgi:hypothetical protein
VGFTCPDGVRSELMTELQMAGTLILLAVFLHLVALFPGAAAAMVPLKERNAGAAGITLAPLGNNFSRVFIDNSIDNQHHGVDIANNDLDGNLKTEKTASSTEKVSTEFSTTVMPRGDPLPGTDANGNSPYMIVCDRKKGAKEMDPTLDHDQGSTTCSRTQYCTTIGEMKVRPDWKATTRGGRDKEANKWCEKYCKCFLVKDIHSRILAGESCDSINAIVEKKHPVWSGLKGHDPDGLLRLDGRQSQKTAPPAAIAYRE